MKALFTDIRQGRVDDVRRRLDTDPSLVAAVAKAPPKKDDGQSPLQVAIKAGCLEIAELLIDRGANVNYIEATSVNDWRAPVIHDALRATVMRSRWLAPASRADDTSSWVVANSTESADGWYALLVRIIGAGADVHSLDSYGNSCLHRVILDARQLLPRVHFDDPTWVDPKPLNDELVHDLTRVFRLLYENGVDPDRELDRHSGSPLSIVYRQDSVGPFLDSASLSAPVRPTQKKRSWRSFLGR